MAGLCEGGNEPPCSLKASKDGRGAPKQSSCGAHCLSCSKMFPLTFGVACGTSMMAQPLISLFKFESIYVAHSVNFGLAEVGPLHGLLVLLILPHSSFCVWSLVYETPIVSEEDLVARILVAADHPITYNINMEYFYV
ncbi:hypothetical protein ANN_04333 [Periplaneta americana]|uniref:Uncharacterized protein n=1 Tax=Periplaneta americana TaxID=6978 RepID=A0ABQ8TAA8_PERAM|nr:hypothetical protein ANN_04333 [Periplaneta americana]